MIFNKYLSIIISACLFLFLMALTSMLTLSFFKGGPIPFIGLFFVVVFYFISRAFYAYLRNDDFYKNNTGDTCSFGHFTVALFICPHIELIFFHLFFLKFFNFSE